MQRAGPLRPRAQEDQGAKKNYQRQPKMVINAKAARWPPEAPHGGKASCKTPELSLVAMVVPWSSLEQVTGFERYILLWETGR